MWALVAFLLLFEATDFNAEGRKALDAEDYAAAAGWFTQAVAADATDYFAHFHLALADSLLNKDEEAIAEYRKVLELKPGLYEAELNLGIVLLRRKRAGEAVVLLKPAAEAKPAEYRPRFYLAEALLAAGELEPAEQEYKAAVELNPKAAEAELGLARAQSRQNRLPEAAIHFRKAAELDPAFEDALFELAALYEKNQQFTDALPIYRQFPDNAAAVARAGELLLESKQYADAAAALEQAFQKNPTPANRMGLATAYLLNKQLDKAVPLLAQSVAADPANYDIRMMLGRALRDQRRFPAAAGQFSEAAKLKPDSREAWNELAVALSISENYPQAVAALDQSLKLGDDTPGIHYLRAAALDKMRDLKGALASYQRFLANSQGKSPDQEFIARQRVRIIQRELSKR
jgi:tetratricopeptide (TPR) repeat protein